jgi:metalloprotein, YbeY/UPF0054 family
MTIDIIYAPQKDKYKEFEKLDYEVIINMVITAVMEYEKCPFEIEINVEITYNEEIQEINHEHRGINSPTDVLSFPLVDYEIAGDFSHLETDEFNTYFNPDSGELMLGDIVISVDKVIEQSVNYGHSLKRELAFLVAHSMLHLFGYDHLEDIERQEMEKKQEIILNEIGITRED